MHFCGNMRLADNYTSAIYILIRQVISENRFIFSRQITYQNLTLCRGREKDGLYDHTKYLFFNRTAAVYFATIRPLDSELDKIRNWTIYCICFMFWGRIFVLFES